MQSCSPRMVQQLVALLSSSSFNHRPLKACLKLVHYTGSLRATTAAFSTNLLPAPQSRLYCSHSTDDATSHSTENSGEVSTASTAADEETVVELLAPQIPSVDGRTLAPRRAIRNLQAALRWSAKVATQAVESNPEVKYRTSAKITDTVTFLRKAGIKEERIRNNPWVLSLKTKTLSQLFHLAKAKLPREDISTLLPILQIPVTKLKILLDMWGEEIEETEYGSRISYLADKLQCEPHRMAKLMMRVSFLKTVPLDRLLYVTDKFLEYNVATEDILKDMWVYRHSELLIYSRLKRAHDAGLKVIKPWMMRCPEATFQRSLRRRYDEKHLLGDGNVLHYLKERLNSNEEFIQKISLSNPRLPQVSVGKLKEMLDLLFSEGYTPEEVQVASRVLCHSYPTVRSRLQELKNLGYRPVSLNVLYKTRAQYEEMLEKLLARKEEATSA